MADTVLNLGNEGGQGFVQESVVQRSTDPVIVNYTQPADFAAQYPQPLDVTEILTMCEEVNLWRSLPEKRTALNGETWREMTSLAFTSGSLYISFTDGACPEEYTHDGANTTVNTKLLGAKKSLTIRDIMHSAAVAAGGLGINQLVGGFAAGEGDPGGGNLATFQRENIRNMKEKEVRLGMTLVMNGWDRLLVEGNATSNSLEFDGIENWATNRSCTFHTNVNTASGTFSAATFDRYLSEACAKPTHLLGHPQAMQELMSAYFQLGFAGSQVINVPNGNRITPGFNFGGYVNTGVGTLAVIADSNFALTTMASTFQAVIYAMRFTHNGEPLVYKLTQIPLSFVDLTPGCSAISFQIFAATALIIKACCAQGAYTTQMTGRQSSTCTQIG